MTRFQAHTTAPQQRHIDCMRLLILAALTVISTSLAYAQEFSVTRFDVLQNDISAYMEPVRDLNGEACALLRVSATSDFTFSTPLGIVRREDDNGEILLYLPRGTKKITIKHPLWGVMRDYKFSRALESRMTYELVISPPKQQLLALQHDTVVVRETRVDTLLIEQQRKKVPLTASFLATMALHQNGPSWGVMLMALRRHGFFVSAQTNFQSVGKTSYVCDSYGYIDESSVKPYYSGRSRHASYALTAGLAHRLGRSLCLFEGGGYGRMQTAWQLAEIEGGGYALCSDKSHKGWAAQMGLLFRARRVAVSVSVLTIKGKQWQAVVGVGINLYKHK